MDLKSILLNTGGSGSFTLEFDFLNCLLKYEIKLKDIFVRLVDYSSRGRIFIATLLTRTAGAGEHWSVETMQKAKKKQCFNFN